MCGVCQSRLYAALILSTMLAQVMPSWVAFWLRFGSVRRMETNRLPAAQRILSETYQTQSLKHVSTQVIQPQHSLLLGWVVNFQRLPTLLARGNRTRWKSIWIECQSALVFRPFFTSYMSR